MRTISPPNTASAEHGAPLRHAARRRGAGRSTTLVLLAATGLLALAACSIGPGIVEAAPGLGGGEPPAPTDGVFGEADGVMEDNTLTPFDTGHPGIANLDPDLLDAVQQASEAASEDDITLFISSGWRSHAYQQHLLDAAILEYGSEEAARAYVASPDGSAHTRGAAVDIGATDADYWLIQYGADFGLCQTYANEIWHFELATSPGGECPEQLPDAG